MKKDIQPKLPKIKRQKKINFILEKKEQEIIKKIVGNLILIILR